MERKLFTPGPLNTSRGVKEAMLRDLGSRDPEFIEVVREIRRELVSLAAVPAETWTAVPLQGSGTFGVEAALQAAVPRDEALLVLANGAYGRRLGEIALRLGLRTDVLDVPEEAPLSSAGLQRALARERYAAVAFVHCETSTGLFNPAEELAAAARERGATVVVDAMSSFGAVPVDLENCDFLVSSANKCIESVPGFSFVLARLATLRAAEGRARSLSLDLHAQWKGLEKDGQFRFTPPTHALLAFRQALRELRAEGGVAGRAARYRENHRVLVERMRKLGFRELLAPELQGYIITSFLCPPPPFSFENFYGALFERGFVIYPGKVSRADCFRIGHIGRLYPADMEALAAAIAEVWP
jgi:2-aminoethylphosphonate-pyruvate transaminase